MKIDLKFMERPFCLRDYNNKGIEIFIKYSLEEHLLLDVDIYAMSLIILGRLLE